MINSSCASASNSTGSGDTFRPGRQSFAYFNSHGSSFPFSDGIVLVSSTAQSAVGPFVSDVNEGANDSPQWGHDSDLDEILGIRSLNTTVLEFDFIAYTSSLSFNYIFASNEYQYNYPCQYSDGFAFLIKEVGTTDPYKNLAVLPNTNTPVSSVNIRPKIEPGTRPGGVVYQGCAASNESYFNGLNTNTSPVNYAGQTVVMTAQSTVTAGKKYHVKLVIGDADVRYQNSAIFLEAGSFASKITLGNDRTIASNNPACFGETILLDSKLTTADYTFKWYKKDNPAVILGTNSTFEVTEAGNYKVEATVNGTACILSGEIKVEYAPEILSTDTPLLQCDDDADGISIFDLNKVNNIVKNNVADISNEGYYETLANAQNKTNQIATPGNYINQSNNQLVYARLENTFGCYKIAQVTLQIANTPIADPNPINTCDGDEIQDGLYHFNLDTEVTPEITEGAGLPSGLTAIYYLTANNALTETNPLPNIFNNTIAFNQTIYARVVNGPSCYDVVPVKLVVNTFDPPNFEEETQSLCKGSETTLTVATGFSSYLWNTGSTDNFIRVNTAGDYQVTVTDNNGCKKTKKYKVILSEPAMITGAEIEDFAANQNSVLLQYSGSGNYEFSLDGIIFQDEPLFENVKPGVYNAIARDKNGCGLSNIYPLYVLDYPRFFTPNGDTYNDLWYIENSNQLPDFTISIFDRYGKLLKQMNQNSGGWNGIFNGEQLPSSDYWFNLLFADGRTVKGHFSLKR
ncbi:choice-of-anchor L domain-containing protein [Flavobacterium aquidurense]|uniref:T9SS type B sorting domain-containing protein n=1 Tax=Flavobacterium aquidurense TaxID=362413 RepID=UPI00285A7827|nr:choice-of-anchor L domain-containing protein [Flavobacterium aquidurense]MDR7371238.1 gliding motility-associated-like protein [Flavobacterium aquidurense]